MIVKDVRKEFYNIVREKVSIFTFTIVLKTSVIEFYLACFNCV